MVRIEAITPDLAQEYRIEITQFYYENVRSNQYYEHFRWEEAEEKIRGFIKHLENDECTAFGAFEDEKIIGFIWAYPHRFREENRMYVNEIRVREEYRGKGYGKKLLTLIEERAMEMGFTAVYLHAEANNADARCFYADRGYNEERIQLRKRFNNNSPGL